MRCGWKERSDKRAKGGAAGRGTRRGACVPTGLAWCGVTNRAADGVDFFRTALAQRLGTGARHRQTRDCRGPGDRKQFPLPSAGVGDPGACGERESAGETAKRRASALAESGLWGKRCNGACLVA